MLLKCQKAAVRRKLRDRNPDLFSAFEIFDHAGLYVEVLCTRAHTIVWRRRPASPPELERWQRLDIECGWRSGQWVLSQAYMATAPRPFRSTLHSEATSHSCRRAMETSTQIERFS